MYPGLVSSTVVTACQLPPFATWLWVGYAIVVLVYRTRFSVLWSPAADADTQTTWRYPLESIAIEGSAESRVKTSGLSADRPDARMTCAPHVEPLVSELRINTIRSHVFVSMLTRSTEKSVSVVSPVSMAPTKRMFGLPPSYSSVVRVYVWSTLSSEVAVSVIRVVHVVSVESTT